MQETMRVFALLGDAPLRRLLQRQWRSAGVMLCGIHAEGGDSITEELARVRPDVVVVDVESDGARGLVQAATVRLRVPVVALVRSQQPGFAALRPLEWGAAVCVPRECDSVSDLVLRLEVALAEVREAQVVDVIDNHFPLSGAFPDASVFDMRRALQSVEPAGKVVAVCGGVGGPMAMRRILHEVRTSVVSPIVFAQRVPEVLVNALVQWLEHHTGAQTVRATTGRLAVGTVYVVPSGFEARVESHSGAPTLVVAPSELLETPSFDRLFESVATTYAERSVAVLLSGRGEDGTAGLLAVRRTGGLTVVQDRVSSLVYDAPGHARDGGGVVECLPINEIAERISMLMRPEPAPRG